VFELRLLYESKVAAEAAAANRPNGLLTAIATVCVVGSAIAVIRAIITYRLFSNN
jgi:hypothetical protein